MNSLVLNEKLFSPLIIFIRHGHIMRGKPPGVAKSLSQILASRRGERDPELYKRHDIGYPSLRSSRAEIFEERSKILKANKSDRNLEKLARNKEITINLDEMKKEWIKTAGPLQIRKIAEHYGVFRHLFGSYAYFTPRVQLSIKFDMGDENLMPVFYGNRIKPREAQKAPDVSFDSKTEIDGAVKTKESLWTLILTNPDGHFHEKNKEYVHWMIGNIPNGDVSKGELVVPYLQPIPPKGTGYHRHIFILYKQDKKIELKDYKINSQYNLEERTFDTFAFYKKHQDFITPAGLAFFQADWDETLKNFYHEKLNMKEPKYEYDFPENILKEPTHFPIKQPFNLYMDRYKDPKDVNKRFLIEKLSKTHPFNGPEKPLRFPNAHDIRHLPSWLQTEMRKKNLGLGRINDMKQDD